MTSLFKKATNIINNVKNAGVDTYKALDAKVGPLKTKDGVLTLTTERILQMKLVEGGLNAIINESGDVFIKNDKGAEITLILDKTGMYINGDRKIIVKTNYPTGEMSNAFLLVDYNPEKLNDIAKFVNSNIMALGPIKVSEEIGSILHLIDVENTPHEVLNSCAGMINRLFSIQYFVNMVSQFNEKLAFKITDYKDDNNFKLVTSNRVAFSDVKINNIITVIMENGNYRIDDYDAMLTKANLIKPATVEPEPTVQEQVIQKATSTSFMDSIYDTGNTENLTPNINTFNAAFMATEIIRAADEENDNVFLRARQQMIINEAIVEQETQIEQPIIQTQCDTQQQVNTTQQNDTIVQQQFTAEQQAFMNQMFMEQQAMCNNSIQSAQQSFMQMC